MSYSLSICSIILFIVSATLTKLSLFMKNRGSEDNSLKS